MTLSATDKKNSRRWKSRDREYHEEKSVVSTYDKWVTRKYHLEHKHYTIDKWVQQIEESKKTFVLDFGCGTGTSTIKLLQKGIAAVSLDASLEMLRVIKSKAETGHLNGLYVVGDIENLPFKENVFDGLICAGVLHHTPDIEKGVKNQSYVLKNKGLLFIAEPFLHKPWFSYPYYLTVKVCRSLFDLIRRREVKTRERLLTRPDINTISSILKANDFTVRLSYFVYWPLLCGYLPERIIFPVIDFMTRLSRGTDKGDTVIVSAQKSTN